MSQEPEARLALGRALIAAGEAEVGRRALEGLVADYGATAAGATARGILEGR